LAALFVSVFGDCSKREAASRLSLMSGIERLLVLQHAIDDYQRFTPKQKRPFN